MVRDWLGSDRDEVNNLKLREVVRDWLGSDRDEVNILRLREVV